jgi:hypothetical protein
MKAYRPSAQQRANKPCGAQLITRLLALTLNGRRAAQCACSPGHGAAAAAAAAEEVIAIIEGPGQPNNDESPATTAKQTSRQASSAAAAGSDTKEPLYKVGWIEQQPGACMPLHVAAVKCFLHAGRVKHGKISFRCRLAPTGCV